MKQCDTCVHWHPKQRELNYSDHSGACLCPRMNFNISDGRMAGVIDLGNLRDRREVSGNPSHDFESMGGEGPLRIKHSRYILATSREFGCVFHTEAQPHKEKKDDKG